MADVAIAEMVTIYSIDYYSEAERVSVNRKGTRESNVATNVAQ